MGHLCAVKSGTARVRPAAQRSIWCIYSQLSATLSGSGGGCSTLSLAKKASMICATACGSHTDDRTALCTCCVCCMKLYRQTITAWCLPRKGHVVRGPEDSSMSALCSGRRVQRLCE